MLITKVKAESVTSLTEGRYFSGMGVDYIGFSFTENKPNSIQTTLAKEIMDWLSGPTFVAEISGSSPESIKTICTQLNISTIQTDQQIDFTQLPPQIEEVIVNILIDNKTTETSLSNWMTDHKTQVSYYILDVTQFDNWEKVQSLKLDKVMQNLASQFPCFIKWFFEPELLIQALDFIKPMGVVLATGNELSVGMQSFEEVDKLIELLEEP